MINTDGQWDARYELTPVLKLPEVDISVSVRARLFPNTTLARILRVAVKSRAILVAYLAYLFIVVIILFTPASTGRTLGIVGTVLGISGAFTAVASFRYDIVVLLLKTYEVWFFLVVSSIVTVLMSFLLHDARSSVIILSWFSFLINVFTDASVVGVSQIWIPQILSTICYSLMYITLGTETIDNLHFFDLFRSNGRSFPAAAIARNGLSTMVVIVLRGLYREFQNAPSKSKVASHAECRVVECVSYRCRLRVQQAGITPTIPKGKELAEEGTASIPSNSTKTRFRFVPFFEPVDARDTVIPHGWISISRSNSQTTASRVIFMIIGHIGFSITSAATLIPLVAPRLARQPEVAVIATLGTGASLVFISLSMALMHRQVLRAVVTSFDFLFIAVQGTVVHIALVELTRWQPVMAQAMLSSWLWSSWILCWDAILPPSRQALGLKTRFAACVGVGLITILVTCTCMTLMVLPPEMVNDRVIWTFRAFGQTVELRPFSWYVSCSASISAWAVRVMWRLCRANEDELVVLDGAVVYNRRTGRSHGDATCRPVDAVTTFPVTPPAEHAVIPS